MNKNLPSWAYGLLSVAGVALVVSLFLPWIDIGWESASGFSIAWEDKHWLFLVPITGMLLLAAASTKSEMTRLAAIAAGVVVAGNVLFHFAKGMLDGGLDTWLVLGGAGVILGGAGSRGESRRGWRVAGGAAVLAGFFAPWDNESLWSALTSDHLDLLTDGFGLTVRVLWLIPVAGLLAIAAGVSAHAKAGRMALIAGLLVYGSIGWVLASVANLVLGIGAWGALAASSLALVIGVLAPRR